MKEMRLIHSFSRRQGRALHPNARRLVDELLPRLQITLPAHGKADPHDWFAKVKHVQMEIGFGGGEYLAAQAEAHPEIGYIGCEPYMNGVAKLLATIEDKGLSNIRLYTNDARLLAAHLPDRCLQRIDILFPDPWPKLRHHKRRLVSLQTLSELARLQPQGAELWLATDHRDYAAWMLEVLLQSTYYEWQAESQADWQTPPEGWVQTRYQEKTSAEGREALFLLAKRM